MTTQVPTPSNQPPEISYPVYDNVPVGPGSHAPQDVQHHWQIPIDKVDQPQRERRLLEGAMGLIIAHCSDYPPISHDRSIELVERSRLGDKKAREELILHFQRFVIYHAKQEYPQARRLRVPMEDLVQDGMTGLIRASDKTDLKIAKDVEGSIRSYFSIGIKQAIQRGLAGKSRLIHLPYEHHNQARALILVQSSLRAELGREPTDFEIAERAGLMPSKPVELIGLDESEEYDEFSGKYPERVINQAKASYARAREAVVEGIAPILSTERHWVSLDTFVRDRKGEIRPLHETLPDEAIDSEIIDYAADSVLSDDIAKAMDVLSPRDQLLLELRFGLGSDEPKTLDEVGVILNISRERVRQIETNLIRKLGFGKLKSPDQEELHVENSHHNHSGRLRTYIDHVSESVECANRGRDSWWIEHEAQEAEHQRQSNLLTEIAKRRRESAATHIEDNLQKLADDYMTRCDKSSLSIDTPVEEAHFVGDYQARAKGSHFKFVRHIENKKVLRKYAGLAAYLALSFKADSTTHAEAWSIARRTLFLTMYKFERGDRRFVDVYIEHAQKALGAQGPEADN